MRITNHLQSHEALPKLKTLVPKKTPWEHAWQTRGNVESVSEGEASGGAGGTPAAARSHTSQVRTPARRRKLTSAHSRGGEGVGLAGGPHTDLSGAPSGERTRLLMELISRDLAIPRLGA